MRSATVCLMLCLLASPFSRAQEDPSAAAKEHIAKVVENAEAWVFRRDWDTAVSCPELNGVVETMVNLQIRKAMSGMPIAPPTVRVQNFILSRRGRKLTLRVRLGGLPEEMRTSAEKEANQWLATAPQANALKSLLVQPLGFPTLGQGSVLKDAKLRVDKETDTMAEIIITPSPAANPLIMGRRVQTLGLRIDKASHAVLLLQAGFGNGAMLMTKFNYEPVKAKDGTSFQVPTTVVFRQRGLDGLAPGVALPGTTTMTYGNYAIGAGAPQQ